MGTLTTQKRKSNGVQAEHASSLVPMPELPFFLNSMRDEMDRLFARFGQLWEGNGTGWKWNVAVEDQDDAIVIRAEAPGFEPGDFDVYVRDSELVLKASKKAETKDKEGKVREVRQQECYEAVVIPAGIDKDKVNATYHNGLLTVTLPKTAEGKGKRIPVTAS